MSIAEFRGAQGVMLSLSKHGGRGGGLLSEPLIRVIGLNTLRHAGLLSEPRFVGF